MPILPQSSVRRKRITAIVIASSIRRLQHRRLPDAMAASAKG
jgi:hypothetical protein